MAGQLGLRLGKWLYRKGKVDEDQIDVIRYAFEILCSELTSFMTIILFGLLTKQFLETLLYLIFFHTLRQCYHGYHAKTIVRCFTLTMVSYFSTMFIYSFVSDGMVVLFLTLSLLLQIEYCIRKHSVGSFVISIVLFMIVMIARFVFMYENAMLLFSLVDLMVSVSLIPERSTYEKQIN